MTTTVPVDLRAEAAAEVRRLTSARAFAREGDDRAVAGLEADGPWITRARRPTLRRFVGRRLMLIWRVAYDDAGGGCDESRLVLVVVELGAGAFPASARRTPSREFRGLAESAEAAGRQADVGDALGASWITARLREIDSDARARIDADSREWLETVERIVRSFASARIRRERGIAAGSARAGSTAFQPGLFDRRAERAQRAHAAATAESDRITADRLASSERFAPTARGAARLLLVLAP